MQASNCEIATPREASSVGVLVEEITSLVDKVNSIDARFLEVRRALVKTPFDPDDEFGESRKRFIDLLWKSRRIAGRARVANDDFCGNMLDLLLSDAGTSREEKLQEFEAVMSGWKNDGEIDSQLSQDFEELSNTLKGFGTALTERVARATDAEAKLHSEIDQLDAELARVNVSEPVLRRFLLVVTGACQQASQSFQRVGTIRTWLVAIDMVISLVFGLVYKSIETVDTVLRSCLRGSISSAFRAVFSAVDEAISKFQDLQRSLEVSGGQKTSSEDLKLQISALQGDLHDIQLALDRRPDIMGGVDAITADLNSLSSEVTSLNDIFNLLTAESAQILLVLRSDSPVVDLPVGIAALRRELAPVGRALAAYSRAQVI